MAHGTNEANHDNIWVSRVHAVADDVLLELHREYESIFTQTQERLDRFERSLPDYVSPRSLSLLQKATEIAVSKATDRYDFLHFRLPSIYCSQAPLLITATPTGNESFKLASSVLSQETRWDISIDRGNDTTWRDRQGIVAKNGRFFAAEYYDAPNGKEVDVLLEAEKWSLPGIRLL